MSMKKEFKTDRPGQIGILYTNKKNIQEYGQIFKYNDKYKTLDFLLFNGKCITMTWSTFKLNYEPK